MVIVFCLTGKAQRFANCKKCASFRLLFYAVRALKMSCYLAKSLQIVMEQRYHPDKDGHARKGDSYQYSGVAWCEERASFMKSTHQT